jgi:hypothetical protein
MLLAPEAMPLVNVGEQQVEYGSLKFYGLCGIGGILSCGITHTAIVPLDLIKCRIQVYSEKQANADAVDFFIG